MAKTKINSLFDIASEEVKKSILEIRELIDQARFHDAFKITEKLNRNHPGDFLATRMYSMLLADSAETLSFKKRSAQKRKACQIMRTLLRKPLGQPPRGVPLRDYYSLRNELYFHSGQWGKQAKLGERFLGKLPSANYSMCVGYAWMAAKYYCNGKMKIAKKFAQKSLDHSDAASILYPKFYNLYLHLSLAAGIAEGIESAECYLTKASKLSGRPSDYYEFEEIRYVLRHKKLKDDY